MNRRIYGKSYVKLTTAIAKICNTNAERISSFPAFANDYTQNRGK